MKDFQTMSAFSVLVAILFHVAAASANAQCQTSATFIDAESTPFQGIGWRYSAQGGPNTYQIVGTIRVKGIGYDRKILIGNTSGPFLDEEQQFFGCLSPGDYTTTVQMVCQNGNVQSPFGPVHAAEFTVTPDPQPLVLQAEPINPPTPAANVKISYSFPKTAGALRLWIDGATGGDPLFFIPTNFTDSIDVFLSPGAHTVDATGCLGNTNGTSVAARRTIVVPASTPAAIVQFDTPNQDDGKILISKALWDIGYPSALQRASSSAGQAQIRIAGTRRDAATHEPRAGIVHLRVIDPPDSAPYRGADARDGDNDGTPATINGAATATIQTDPQGRFEATLVATSHVAGDNYQVAGSADASFNCGTVCQRTTVFTLWKRIYVEEQQMFRRGSFLNDEAQTGTNEIPIRDPVPFLGLTAGQELQLIHAESGLGEGFYSDRVAFDSLRLRPDNIWVLVTASATPIPRKYGAPPNPKPNPFLDVIRDGVGVVSAGTFKTNSSHTGPLFASMFVDLKPIASAVTEVPYLGQLQNKTANVFFANRWLQQGVRTNEYGSRPDPNVFHRIAARQAILVQSSGGCHGAQLGITSVGGNANYSYIFDQRIQDLTAGVVADPAAGCPPVGGGYLNAPASTVNGEITAHETVHFWVRTARQPDLDAEGHCPRRRYIDTTNCLMHTPYSGPELYDGQVLLHYDLHGAHSEYMWVRRDPDPVPQQ